MLTLKRFFLEYTDNDKDLFTHLALDTEKSGYISNVVRIFIKDELVIQKPWIGTVDREQNQFKVVRTRTGVFKTGVSSVVVLGKLVHQENRKGLEVRIRPSRLAMLTVVCMMGFISFTVIDSNSDFFGWAMFLCIAIILVLFLILDLNKTENTFRNYVEQIRRNTGDKRHHESDRQRDSPSN